MENIVTTQDELYKAILSPNDFMSSETKEVLRYREAIYSGLEYYNEQNCLLENVL
ncbi:MAG: hypothetical protein H0U27_02175 [Nitrosopumilus sp.]|nr:hypothetical protein [Nitrosopumilus sp.]